MIRMQADFYEFLTFAQSDSIIADMLLTDREFLSLSGGASYLKLRTEDGFISYFPGNREIPPYEDIYSAKGRRKGRPARIIRSLLPDYIVAMLTDQDFEVFADQVKAYCDRFKGEFSIVPASLIPHWYHYSNHAKNMNIGTLETSCLRHDESQLSLHFFEEALGDQVRLLLYLNQDEEVMGRALLWTLPDGDIFMDRIYGTEVTQEIFKDHARSNGWWHRLHQSYRETTSWVNPDGKTVERTVTLEMGDELPEAAPYLDTMYVLNLKNRTLSNESTVSEAVDFDTVLRGTTGDYGFSYVCQNCHYIIYRTAHEWWEELATDQEPSCTHCTRHNPISVDLRHLSGTPTPTYEHAYD